MESIGFELRRLLAIVVSAVCHGFHKLPIRPVSTGSIQMNVSVQSNRAVEPVGYSIAQVSKLFHHVAFFLVFACLSAVQMRAQCVTSLGAEPCSTFSRDGVTFSNFTENGLIEVEWAFFPPLTNLSIRPAAFVIAGTGFGSSASMTVSFIATGFSSFALQVGGLAFALGPGSTASASATLTTSNSTTVCPVSMICNISNFQGGLVTIKMDASATASATNVAQAYISTVYLIPSRLSVAPPELVDPVPSLLSALSAQDTNALTTGGRLVQGVAADGVSEVLVRIPVSTPGAIVNLTLQNDQGNTSSSPEDDGVLTSIDGLQSGSAFQVVATNGSNPMVLALYRAPTDFPRTMPPPGPVTCGGVTGTDDQLSCRQVSIRADDLTSVTTATTSVTILRPPVVLIHGIWSSQSTWDFFLPLVTGSNSSDPRFHIYRIDYSQQAGDSVDSIERGALDQLMGFTSSFKAAFSVAAVQADVVAHSMGGLVARDMVLDSRFSAAENFSQGFIHKLITIGTPHNGSQLATKLLASSSLCKGAFGLLRKPVSGGVTDMSIGNSFLNFLNNASRPISLRAHAIVGTASVAQELASQIGFDSIVWGVSNGLVCSNLLPPIGGYESLFGGPSDLLVSAPSQSFGFNPSAVDKPSENMIHTVAPIIYPLGPDELNRDLSILGSPISHSGTPVNPDLVLGLLNTPIGSTSNAFVAIHP